VTNSADGAKDPATLPAGAKAAQRWAMGNGRNDLFSLYRDVAVIPGQWYTFTAQTRVDAKEGAALYRVLIDPTHGSPSPHLYYSGALGQHAYATGFHRAAFRIPPGVTSIRLCLSNVNNDPSVQHDDPSCWTDGGTTAWFGRCRLEAGRDVSTEAHSVGLMGQVQTTAPRLTAQPAISVTHPFHTIAAPVPPPPGGPVAIQTITPPAGWHRVRLVRHRARNLVVHPSELSRWARRRQLERFDHHAWPASGRVEIGS
jgi:hypothetical protein